MSSYYFTIPEQMELFGSMRPVRDYQIKLKIFDFDGVEAWEREPKETRKDPLPYCQYIDPRDIDGAAHEHDTHPGLVESIKNEGIIIPLLLIDGYGPANRLGKRYYVLEGHRRLRAALILGLETVPAIAMTEDVEYTKIMLELDKNPKLNLGAGAFPLEGFLNMDIRTDLESIFEKRHFEEGIPWYVFKRWDWRNGLQDFEDNSVEAITESHSLMYLQVKEYETALKECYRVLRPGHIMRITQDNCEYPDCDKFGLPWGNPDSITGPKMMRRELENVGFTVYDVEPNETRYKNKSLIQEFHGTPPRVFHIEAVKRR